MSSIEQPAFWTTNRMVDAIRCIESLKILVISNLSIVKNSSICFFFLYIILRARLGTSILISLKSSIKRSQSRMSFCTFETSFILASLPSELAYKSKSFCRKNIWINAASILRINTSKLTNTSVIPATKQGVSFSKQTTEHCRQESHSWYNTKLQFSKWASQGVMRDSSKE